MPPNAVDWVLLEFREGVDPLTADSVASKAAILLDNGIIVDVDGTSEVPVGYVFSENIYVVIYHRNHLGIMSALPLTMNPGDSFYSYDFTDDILKTVGGSSGIGIKDISTGPTPVFGLIGGNGEFTQVPQPEKKGGVIGTGDFFIWLDQSGGGFGYHSPDYDMDGLVNNGDFFDLWQINNNTGSQVP
jgi:hypothetical protein